MDDATKQLLRLVAREPRNVAARLAQAMGVSRQAASARLFRAVKAGLMARTGQGAGVRYALSTQTEVRQRYPRAGLSEDRVWQQLLAPLVADLPENVRDVWR